MRRRRRTTCRQAKDAFVATMRVDVGPGVKMELNRFVRKADMMITTASDAFCGMRALKSLYLGEYGSAESALIRCPLQRWGKSGTMKAIR